MEEIIAIFLIARDIFTSYLDFEISSDLSQGIFSLTPAFRSKPSSVHSSNRQVEEMWRNEWTVPKLYGFVIGLHYFFFKYGFIRIHLLNRRPPVIAHKSGKCKNWWSNFYTDPEILSSKSIFVFC